MFDHCQWTGNCAGGIREGEANSLLAVIYREDSHWFDTSIRNGINGIHGHQEGLKSISGDFSSGSLEIKACAASCGERPRTSPLTCRGSISCRSVRWTCKAKCDPPDSSKVGVPLILNLNVSGAVEKPEG